MSLFLTEIPQPDGSTIYVKHIKWGLVRMPWTDPPGRLRGWERGQQFLTFSEYGHVSY